MSFRTNKTTLLLRNMGRQLGVNQLIMKVAGSKSYEDKFNEARLSCVKTNDCVWDAGANIGYYTKQFANIVGLDGKVVAFEPSPQNFNKLSFNLDGVKNVSLLPYGLGAKDDKVPFKQGDDELGATSQVLDPKEYGEGNFAQVEIRCADNLVQSGLVSIPNMIKIDVEGFELEVLDGMRQILNRDELRALAIEVHFGLLAKRGMAHAPQRIESLLRETGFSCSWPDNSHILATRQR